jgi:CRP-like cAMP-binding protein
MVRANQVQSNLLLFIPFSYDFWLSNGQSNFNCYNCYCGASSDQSLVRSGASIGWGRDSLKPKKDCFLFKYDRRSPELLRIELKNLISILSCLNLEGIRYSKRKCYFTSIKMLLTYQNDTQKSSPLQAQERRLHFYQKGEEIPLISQGIWQVNRGVVQLGKLDSSGQQTLLGWVQPLNFFGLWLTNIDTYQATALSNVYLKWYALKEIEISFSLSQIFLNQIVMRMRQTESLLAIAGIKRVEDRLIQLLKLLKKDLGEPVSNGTRIIVRLTHENLANLIGTTRVTVTRILGHWQRQGLISFDGDRHLVIEHQFRDSIGV